MVYVPHSVVSDGRIEMIRGPETSRACRRHPMAVPLLNQLVFVPLIQAQPHRMRHINTYKTIVINMPPAGDPTRKLYI